MMNYYTTVTHVTFTGLGRVSQVSSRLQQKRENPIATLFIWEPIKKPCL